MINITTLGSLKVEVNGIEVSEKYARTTKLWKLLNLLIINRGKPLSAGTIIESIWPDEDDDDTGKALHNLVYRLRKLLSYEGAPCFIFYKNNCYTLQTGNELVVDAYVIEDLFGEAKNPSLPEERRADLLRKAVELYKGDYILSSFDADIWALPAVSHYKHIYVDIVCMLAKIYYTSKRYNELVDLCRKAAILEPLEGAVQEYLVKALRAKGKTMQAITICENYFDILYREMGVSASDTLNSLYKEMKNNNIVLQHNVDHALSELKEFSSLDRALLCNYETFKDIYRYEERRAERLGHKIIIILISISDKRNDVPPVKTLSEARRRLHECCMSVLRKGDVISDYSQTQIIAMITSVDEEHINPIISRLEDQYFSSSGRGGDIRIRFEYKLSGL